MRVGRSYGIARRGVLALAAAIGVLGWLGAAPVWAKASSGVVAVAGFAEALVAATTPADADEKALSAAIEAHQRRARPDDLTALETYLAQRPASPWGLALLTNLGLVRYQYGYFSGAIQAWESVWSEGAGNADPAVSALVDRALGELARMHARLGHADRLEALFAEVGTRPVTGPATEALAGARDGLWRMRNEPGVAFLCGPMAVRSLLLDRGARPAQVAVLDSYQSPSGGVSFPEVARLARRAKLKHRLIHRPPGAAVPVPSVVHWRVGHYAAIVGERGGRLHVKDPTFGQDLWITRAALDAEASGYFLVPDGVAHATGWRRASTAEVAHLRGTGSTTSSEAGATRAQDDTECEKSCQERPAKGLTRYDVHGMLVSLNLRDTPVGYRPPVGPAAQVTFTYNQREAYQPATFGWSNVGPKWTHNWLSYIEDDPTLPGASVLRYVAGGGAVLYGGYAPGTGSFARETLDAAQLVYVSASPPRYERRLPDGRVEVYAQSDGAIQYPRRVFLSEVRDPAGNAVTLSYDAQLRLTALTDATGRVTTFSYELPGQPLLLTRVTDPFGRGAGLDYDATGRLIRITDVIGLTSEFGYDAGSFITTLTTPYGATTFAATQSGMFRTLEITDPLGATEAVHFRHNTPGIAASEAVVPSGLSPSPFNSFLDQRNTAYWNKHAHALAAGDYTQARIKHWVHLASNTGVTGHTLESLKQPLEGRVWFTYPGQSQAHTSGTFDRPTGVARVLDDATTQRSQYEYDAFGNVVREVDPAARETRYEYASNGVDLLRVKQKTASGDVLLAEYTWNAQHRPLSYRDAAGKLTTYTWNAAGQLLIETRPLGRVWSYEYDTLGYLTRQVSPAGRTWLSFTWDAQGRMATRTDSEGLTLAYAYDALDRLTRITHPDGTAETWTYDKLDVASYTDRLGRRTDYAHDAVRNLVAVTDPLGRTTAFGYYPDGVVHTLTDANGNLTTWERDVAGRVTAKVFADGSRETYAYEASTSRRAARQDRRGQDTQYGYTPDDRLATLAYPNAVEPTPAVALTYDPEFPRLKSFADGIGTTQYSYQAVGSNGALLLKKENGPYGSDAVDYGYDAAGRLTSQKVGGENVQETFAYDSLDRVITHQSALGKFTYQYLGDTAQVTRETRQGVSLSGAPSGSTRTMTRTYLDNAHDRRLAAITHSAGLRSYAYTTDPYRILGVTESGSGTLLPPRAWTYTYDAADRLLSVQGATPQTFTYDPADNLLSQGGPVAQVNALNQPQNWNGQALSYDANGNLTADGTWTYRYDAENRLVRIEAPGGFPYWRFRYDGLGRQLQAQRTDRTLVFGNLYTEETTTRRQRWCGAMICQERNGDDQPRARFYPQGERPANFLEPARYYARDHLGSVREVQTLPTLLSVTVERALDYSAYGSTVASAGTYDPAYRYAGMRLQEATGSYATLYRHYHPTHGRWTTPDPIGEAGGVNLYGYAESNPLTFTDPLGLNPAAGAIAGGSIGGIPGAVIGGIIGLGIGIAVGDAMLNEDGYDATDFPDFPDRDDQNQCDDSNRKKNCQALKNSILSTCAGLTGKAKFRCFEAANTAYRQCMGYE